MDAKYNVEVASATSDGDETALTFLTTFDLLKVDGRRS